MRRTKEEMCMAMVAYLFAGKHNSRITYLGEIKVNLNTNKSIYYRPCRVLVAQNDIVTQKVQQLATTKL